MDLTAISRLRQGVWFPGNREKDLRMDMFLKIPMVFLLVEIVSDAEGSEGKGS